MTATGAPLPVAGDVALDRLREAARWARERLFDSPGNALLTVVIGGLLLYVGYGVIGWFVDAADWGVVRANRRLLLVGRFPHGEEWRLWPVVWALGALVGLTWGAYGRVTWQWLTLMVATGAVLLPLLMGRATLVPVALMLALGVALYAAARALHARPRVLGWTRRGAIAGWLALPPVAVALLLVAGGVEPSLWGGLYLNLVVATTAMMGAIPLAVLLALGRASSYRAVRLTCALYVELMRGLPLVVMLTLAWLALRSFLPSVWGLDSVPLVYRVTIAFALFTAAFLAEAIRGGMQAIPRGQYEASEALGLRWFQTTRFITLPLAVRNSAPALAGELIGLFMATSLVAVVGLTDMLQAARATTEQPDFFGRQKEVLLFVGGVFWMAAFALSRLSGRLERQLGIVRR